LSFFQYDTVPKKQRDTDPRPLLPLEVLDLSETKPLLKNNITDKALLEVAVSTQISNHFMPRSYLYFGSDTLPPPQIVLLPRIEASFIVNVSWDHRCFS